MEQTAKMYNEQLEERVLSTIISDGVFSYNMVRDIIKDECFSSYKCRGVYKALKAVAESGQDIDILTVDDEFRKSTAYEVGYIVELAGNYTSIINELRNSVFALLELSIRRKLKVIADRLQSSCFNLSKDIADTMNEVRESLNELQSDTRTNIVSFGEVLDNLVKIVDNNISNPGSSGIPTGYPYLDEKGGLQKSDLVIVAGASSHGKTSFATSLCVEAIKRGYKAAFYSMEMTKEQLVARIIADDANIPSNAILTQALNKDGQRQFDQAVNIWNAYKDNLVFDDRSVSSAESIIQSIRTMKLKRNIDVAIVDYLQIVNSYAERGTNREQLMGEVARKLKNLAKELNICIVALSQFNRDSNNTEVPGINRLRDSGQIAEAADMVLLVHRPEQISATLKYPSPFENISTHETAMIIMAKGRNIGTGQFVCGFNGERTKFYPLTEYPQSSSHIAPSEYITENDDPFAID